MKLSEIHWTPNETETVFFSKVKEFMDEMGYSTNWKIRNDMVDFGGDFMVPERARDYSYQEFPVKFGIVNGRFDCRNLRNIKTLNNCPESVRDEFHCAHTQISSFKGAPKKIGGGVYATGLKNLTSLVGIADDLPEIGGRLWLSCEHIKEGGLGLLQIKGLTKIIYRQPNIDEKPWEIISKYLGSPDKIFDCQTELINAGYEAFAQL